MTFLTALFNQDSCLENMTMQWRGEVLAPDITVLRRAAGEFLAWQSCLSFDVGGNLAEDLPSANATFSILTFHEQEGLIRFNILVRLCISMCARKGAQNLLLRTYSALTFSVGLGRR
jgi:hypothetical protein